MTVNEMNLRFHTSQNLNFAHKRAFKQFKDIYNALDSGFRRGDTETRFGVFEVYRNPFRQNYLFEQKGSKAKAFQSAHQYGLAIDFVPFEYAQVGKEQRKLWSWAEHHDYAFLKQIARKYGCDVPIAWDLCHVEHPLWWHVKDELL